MTAARLARKAVDKLLVVKEDRIYCQPCVSPVWDTGLTAHALMEAGEAPDGPVLQGAFEWLKKQGRVPAGTPGPSAPKKRAKA